MYIVVMIIQYFPLMYGFYKQNIMLSVSMQIATCNVAVYTKYNYNEYCKSWYKVIHNIAICIIIRILQKLKSKNTNVYCLYVNCRSLKRFSADSSGAPKVMASLLQACLSSSNHPNKNPSLLDNTLTICPNCGLDLGLGFL